MRTGTTVFRCGAKEHDVELSLRDVRLLDGQFFLRDGGTHRRLFALDFVAGLGAPTRGTVLKTYDRAVLSASLGNLLRAFDDQRDLLSADYTYGVEGSGRRASGAQSGFHVRGLAGMIHAYPGYCDIVLSQVAPNGRGRPVEMIDMRAVGIVTTDDVGRLRVYRRKANVGWFRSLPPLLAWLDRQRESEIEVLHRLRGVLGVVVQRDFQPEFGPPMTLLPRRGRSHHADSYNLPGQHNGPNDAFRHCSTGCMIANTWGMLVNRFFSRELSRSHARFLAPIHARQPCPH